MIIELKKVNKSFYLPDNSELTVLSDISFSLPIGQSIALVGPSGSGKTTLLSLCAGLDLASSGNVIFQRKILSDLSETQRTILRRTEMGFIFQNFQLIQNLTALDNVIIPMELAKIGTSRSRQKKAEEYLEMVGLVERSNHYPHQLSGGEQQRVAIARAIIHDPKIIFADEPTGNLDNITGQKITDLLFSIQANKKTSILLVTHNPELAKKANLIINLKGGQIV